MKDVKTNVYFKIVLISVIGLLLLIPTFFITDLISEREQMQQAAIAEVSSKWAGSQTISGPFLSVPVSDPPVVNKKKGDDEAATEPAGRYIHILPEELQITGEINPEKRSRGIYEIVVYHSKLTISGVFRDIQSDALDVPLSSLQWDKTRLNVGISDLRGIKEQGFLDWNGLNLPFDAGTSSHELVYSGIQTAVTVDSLAEGEYRFSFTLDLKGSQKLYFTPLGKQTKVSIQSEWASPSFNGSVLPDSNSVSDAGFSAAWNVSHLTRNYPQAWRGDKYAITSSDFGVDLLIPVDNYQKTYRSIRYAVLFIGLTFLVFFFIEILKKVFVHPIQYLLVGTALVIFYLLLLSISEHLAFNIAFIVSAAATLLLIVVYSRSVLRSGSLASLVGGVLFILYTFIFTVIQIPDHALLIGSLGIFGILALVMYLSRNIDWYNLGGTSTNNNTNANKSE